MKPELKIAIRYIFSKHQFNFITIINFLSLIGITIGVASLIIVLSIFNAFQSIAIQQIVGFDPHIIVSVQDKSKLPEIQKNIKKLPEVKNTAKIDELRAISLNKNTARVVNLISIDTANRNYLDSFSDYMIMGTISPIGVSAFPKVIIGAGLADALHILVGDTINLTTPKEIEKALVGLQSPEFKQAIVGGIYKSNIKDYDFSYIFTFYNINQELISQNNHKIFIKIADINQLENVARKILQTNPEIQLTTWKDLNKEYYGVMKFEKMATTFVLALILLVAIFNVFASLVMTVLEKKKDIAILRAIGSSQQLIKKIYFYDGAIIGILGSIMGGILGLLLCYLQINYKLFKIDASKYIMDAIPVEVHLVDVILIISFALILSFAVTIYPSHRASQLNIAESLREE